MEVIRIHLKDKDREGKLESRLTDFLDDILTISRPMFAISRRFWTPPADVYETCDNIVIKLELAGVQGDSINITTEGNRLIVRGRRTEDITASKENYYIMEIQYGPFERVFSFRDEFVLEDIQAKYENGFLRIDIPKVYKEDREVKIDIDDK